MLVVFGSTVWLHVIRPPSPSKVLIRQGSTVILGDFNTFYYEDVYIGIDDDHYPNITSDDNFILDLYGVPGACADICCHGFYTKDIFVMFTEKNITEFIPIYALVGSSFSFDLSGGASNQHQKVTSWKCAPMWEQLMAVELKLNASRCPFLKALVTTILSSRAIITSLCNPWMDL